MKSKHQPSAKYIVASSFMSITTCLDERRVNLHLGPESCTEHRAARIDTQNGLNCDARFTRLGDDALANEPMPTDRRIKLVNREVSKEQHSREEMLMLAMRQI